MPNGRTRSGSVPSATVSAQRLVRSGRRRSNSTVAAPVRKGIRVAMIKTATKYTPTAQNTVADLFAQVDAAERWFADQKNQADHFNPHFADELRIFLAPEWYFRKVGTPYTHAEMRQLVEDIKRKSATRRKWIVVAGTIYFGLGYDQMIVDPVAGGVTADVQGHFQLTNRAGADVLPVYANPANPTVQWYIGNVCPIVKEGALLHHRFKIYEHDIAEDKDQSGEEKWGMFTLGTVAARRALAGTATFESDGVRFAIDVCRDHVMCGATWSYADAKSRKDRLEKEQDKGVDVQLVVANDVPLNTWGGCVCRDGGHLLRCDGTGSGSVLALAVARDHPPIDDTTLLDEYLIAEDQARPLWDANVAGDQFLFETDDQIKAVIRQRDVKRVEIEEQRKTVNLRRLLRTARKKRAQQEELDRLEASLRVYERDVVAPRRAQAQRDVDLFKDADATMTRKQLAIQDVMAVRIAQSKTLGASNDTGAGGLYTWPGRIYVDDEET